MSCLIYPQVKNKQGEFVDSELFRLLLSLTQDRETTKSIYQIVSNSNWLSQLNGNEVVEATYDNNGELTIDTVSKFINFDNLLSNDATIKKLQRPYAGKTFPNILEAIRESSQFNTSNPDYLALVNKQGAGYGINIVARTEDNLALYNKTVNTANLNDFILSTLKKNGVNVANDNTTAGLFSPQGFELLADGTVTMIKIANNEAGQHALSEEFSHYIVRLLFDDPLIQRGVRALMDDNLVRQILPQNVYDSYMEVYKGDTRQMAEEVLGKLITANLTGVNRDNLNFAPFQTKTSTLLDRIINYLKNMFRRLPLNQINNGLANIYRDIEDFSNALLQGSLGTIIQETEYTGDQFGNIPLLSINNEVLSLEKIANDTLSNLVKRYLIYLDRKKSRDFSVEEKRRILKLLTAIDSNLYVAGLSSFLNDSTKWMNDATLRMNKLYSQKENALSDRKLIRFVASLLRDLRDFVSAYQTPLDLISQLLNAAERGELNIDKATAQTMSAQADLILNQMRKVMNDFDSISFQVVHNYFKEYFGENKVMPASKVFGKDVNAGKELTLEMVMTRADKDINFINRFLDSAADSGDMMIGLFDKAIKATLFEIRMNTERNIHTLRAALNTLKEVHNISNTEFMYERDEKGIPSGYFISDRSYLDYEKARDALHERIILSGTPEDKVLAELFQWEIENTKMELIDSEMGRWERMPRADKFPSLSLQNLSLGLREYYDTIMKMKASMDTLLPESRVNKYKAPLIRTNTTQSILSNLNDPKKATSTAISSIKDMFLRTENDEDFGMLEQDPNGEYSTISAHKDLRGNRIQRVPIYFTHMLSDKSRLSMDATATMSAYVSSATNFHGMNQVVDILELGRDIMREREVTQTKAGKKLRETISALGTSLSSEVTAKGNETNIMNRLDDVFSMNVYGEYKLDEGTLFGTKLDQAKTLDNLATVTSFTTLGLNIFSGVNNVVMGKFQMFMEGVAGEYFNLKDIAIGDKNYMAMLPEYMSEMGSTKLTSKLGLLREFFDVDLNAMVDARHSEYYKQGIARVFGKTGVMVIQNAGENYMSSRTLLAYMNSYKMLDPNGKPTTLFDAMEVRKNIVDGKLVDAHLDLKEGYKKADGSELTLDDLKDVSLRVAKINQSMHGIYNRADRNAIQKWSLGRMAMVFRKWMVPHYNRRFKGMYFDAQMDQWKEGFYITTPRFLMQLYHDVKLNGMTNIPAMWNTLSNNERANVKRALTETSFFLAICLLLGALGDYKDKDTWASRMLQYLLRRLKLELGTSSYPPMMISEAMTILLSPTATLKTGLNIINLFSFTDLGTEIESGRYKGHSVYYRNMDIAIPLFNNIKKARDLATEDYMFTMFK